MMKAYQLKAPKDEPNLRIRRLKERKPSAEAKRESEAPGYLEKIRKLPCCIPSCNEAAPRTLIISNARVNAVSARSLPTNGRSRFAMSATSMVSSASEAVRKLYGSGRRESCAWISRRPSMPTRTAWRR